MSIQSDKVKKWRKNTKSKIVKAMGGECQICGYSKCDEGLDLHHIDPTKKEIGFGRIMANPRNVGKILVELEKCILLCCRCHREIHNGIIELPLNYAKLDTSIFIKAKFSETKSNPKIKPMIAKLVKSRKRFEISKEELSKLIEIYPMTTIGEQFGVSDNAIRRRCKNLQIVLKPRLGYWSKMNSMNLVKDSKDA